MNGWMDVRTYNVRTYIPIDGRIFVPLMLLGRLRYGDGVGNTIEENSSVFSLIRMH